MTSNLLTCSLSSRRAPTTSACSAIPSPPWGCETSPTVDLGSSRALYGSWLTCAATVVAAGVLSCKRTNLRAVVASSRLRRRRLHFSPRGACRAMTGATKHSRRSSRSRLLLHLTLNAAVPTQRLLMYVTGAATPFTGIACPPGPWTPDETTAS
jgi:hypothetical protein